MVTCRWWGNKFCKRSCKDAYLREVAFGRDKILCWYGFLRGGSSKFSPFHPNNQSRATITLNAATRHGSNRGKADKSTRDSAVKLISRRETFFGETSTDAV
jgi:hypothetical protein